MKVTRVEVRDIIPAKAFLRDLQQAVYIGKIKVFGRETEGSVS